MGLGNYINVSRDDGRGGELLAKWVKCSFIFFHLLFTYYFFIK